jgi:hypothetical protein
MKQRLKRGLVWLMFATTGGVLFQTTAVGFTTVNNAVGGCQRFAMNGVLSSVDFCYVLDCQGGFLGGAISPCGDPTTADDNLLIDCGGTTTTTTT